VSDPWAAFPVASAAPDDTAPAKVSVHGATPIGPTTFDAFPVADQAAAAAGQPAGQAPEQMAPNPAASSLPGFAGDLQNTLMAGQSGAMQGMTLGFGDELNAGLMTPIQAGVDAFQGRGFDPGASYQRALQGERALEQGQQALNPPMAIGGNIAGNMVTGGALNGAGLTFLKGARASIPMMALKGAAEGAGYGAVTGFGSGDGLQDRLDQALYGGTTGLAIGSVLGAAGSGLSKMFNGGQPASGLSREADLTLSNAIDNQGGPVPRTPGSMLADQGPITRDLLDVAAQKAGPSAYIARQAVTQRANDANGMLQNVLDTTLGRPASSLDALQAATRANTAVARDLAYKAAYAKEIPYADPKNAAAQDIKLMLPRIPRSAINRANALIRLEGDKSIKPIVYKDGSTSIQPPTVKQMDYITRALNDEAKHGEGAGKMGGYNDVGRAMQNLSARLRAGVKAAVPEYAKALETAATPIQRNEALQFGSEILSPQTKRGDVAEFVAGASKPELAAAREGLRMQLDEVVANVRKLVSDPNGDARQAKAIVDAISSDAAKNKIRTLLGPRDSKRLFAALDQAFQALSLKSSISAGSRTFARTEADNAIKNRLNNTVAGDILDLKPIQAPRRFMQGLTGRSPAALQGKEARYYAELANALTTQGSSLDNMIATLGIKDYRRLNGTLSALTAPAQRYLPQRQQQ
jgi:hypothetical protein